MNYTNILCPSCKKSSLTFDDKINSESVCPGCNSIFPKKNGMLDLLNNDVNRRSFGQVLMEWEPLVNIYESKLWRRNVLFQYLAGISSEKEYELIAAKSNLKPGNSFLDLACGPGIYVRPLAKSIPDATFIGLDLSLPMLNYMSRKIMAENINNIILIHANAMDLPFPDDEFNAVNCFGAIHLFSDLDQVFREIYRVLKKGGVFITGALRRKSGRAGRRVADIRKKIIGVDSYRFEELEELLRNAGFVKVECHHNKGVWLIVSVVK